jgi:hypothetical protein
VAEGLEAANGVQSALSIPGGLGVQVRPRQTTLSPLVQRSTNGRRSEAANDIESAL